MNVSNFKHSLSLQNRFIINNSLFEIDLVSIINLIKLNYLISINPVNYLPDAAKSMNLKRIFIRIVRNKPQVHSILILYYNKRGLIH